MKVLITGATGGIGEALIDILIKNDYEVIALGRSKDKLKELEERYFPKVEGYSLNFNREEEIDNFLKEVEDKKIDMLINGAGVGEIGYLEDIPYPQLKDMIDINLVALTKFTKFFYDKMVREGRGTIVNISSTAGFQQGGALMSVYYGTKAYVNSFTLSLYEEGRGKGVKIFLLTPGPTQTNFKGMGKELSFKEKFYVTTPQEVAQSFWRGLQKNSFIIIPGKINKILYYLDKLIPLKIKLHSIKKIQEKKLKKS